MAISSNPTEISITYNMVCMINMTILSNPTEITGANDAHISWWITCVCGSKEDILISYAYYIDDINGGRPKSLTTCKWACPSWSSSVHKINYVASDLWSVWQGQKHSEITKSALFSVWH